MRDVPHPLDDGRVNGATYLKPRFTDLRWALPAFVHLLDTSDIARRQMSFNNHSFGCHIKSDALQGASIGFAPNSPTGPYSITKSALWKHKVGNPDLLSALLNFHSIRRIDRNLPVVGGKLTVDVVVRLPSDHSIPKHRLWSGYTLFPVTPRQITLSCNLPHRIQRA